ncbi:hypothetical protein H3436_004731 [Escherichia coli]|nr:hypothetical protein [Escherichia coli]EHK7151742.1 hypothetical protein [Escherichia coli]
MDMKSIEKKIIDYIKENQPVNRYTICSCLDISLETYLTATLLLRAKKDIIHKKNIGVFAGDVAYQMWRGKLKKQSA